MIIENAKSEDVLVFGENTSKKATIDATRIKKLQYILTEGLYSDPLGATIVEIANNAMDSVIESGKDPIENPVIVKIEKSGYNEYLLSIEDKGVGMSKDFFENTFMSMLSSTKEDNDEQIGHFGIG
mgnify:CR=1 FL=1